MPAVLTPLRGAVALVGGVLLAGCATVTLTTPTSPTATTPAASAAASQAPLATPTPVPTNPLTGLPQDEPRPVLVVKLDNTGNAQPHAGLTKAEVVYLEEVEYGITRIAAVFSDRVPKRIGPVRSARISDVDLLANYGRPAFAYSGAQRKLYAVLDDAPFHDVSPRRDLTGYTRDSSRYAPYNLFVDGRALLERAPKASVAHDIGFVFDAAVPAGGTPTKGARMAWDYASARFTYDPEHGDYRVTLNGRPAQAEESDLGQRADTVVIQKVRQEPSVYFDKGGGNTPRAHTVGSGTAIVLRDGLSWTVDWSRPTEDSPTTFTLPDGTPMTFAPGQTWVVLLDRKRPVTLTAPRAAASPSASASASPG